MVSMCANPRCSAELRNLRDGRLFVVDPRGRRHHEKANTRHLRWHWLCNACAERFTLEFGSDGEVVMCIVRSNAHRLPEVAEAFAVEG